jgi:acyl dehydratase
MTPPTPAPPRQGEGCALRLPAGVLGASAGPHRQVVDARWLMAYAAGLGETDPRYFDTTAATGPLAHPIFAVCYEWPLAVELREAVIGAAIAPYSVHATHDLVIHRPPRAGDELSTRATVVQTRPIKAGSLVVVKHETVDGRGAPVTTTQYGSIYRGVGCDGGGEASAPAPREARGPVRWDERVEIGAGLAHVYTECARIWNPIHTDLAVAHAAELPGLILHGTATLALAVSRVVGRDLGGDPTRVRGVAVRFTGMVAMPSTLTVRGLDAGPTDLHFDAIDAAGRPVLDRGVIRR